MWRRRARRSPRRTSVCSSAHLASAIHPGGKVFSTTFRRTPGSSRSPAPRCSAVVAKRSSLLPPYQAGCGSCTVNDRVHDLAPRRVLIVEDDYTTALVMSQYLEAYGYRTTVARNGTEGVAKFVDESPDIAFVDCAL